jgi:hypothetical protein
MIVGLVRCDLTNLLLRLFTEGGIGICVQLCGESFLVGRACKTASARRYLIEINGIGWRGLLVSREP